MFDDTHPRPRREYEHEVVGWGGGVVRRYVGTGGGGRGVLLHTDTVDDLGCPVRISADPGHPNYVHPKVSAIMAVHPNLVQIAEREAEIAEWLNRMRQYEEAEDRRDTFGRAVVVLTIVGILVGVLIAPAWGLPLFAAALAFIFRAAAGGVGDKPVDKPQYLVILPHTDAENAILLFREDPTPFRALCGCPGCWDVDTHPIVRTYTASEIRPFAQVVRKCETCGREWAQT